MLGLFGCVGALRLLTELGKRVTWVNGRIYSINIYEYHEFLGKFFLPEDKDDPEKWVPGILKWDPAKGSEIELMGGLFPGFNYEVEQSCKYSLSGEAE